MNKVFLSLGSNEGDRIKWMEKAMELLAINYGTIADQSSIYETGAWGLTAQPDFLNMVICLDTALTPTDLLAGIQEIELALGRQRIIKWGPRTIDIDILFYNDVILNTPLLTIPHPFIQERRFILIPFAQIAPNLQHPILHRTIKELLAACTDNSAVNPYHFANR